MKSNKLVIGLSISALILFVLLSATLGLVWFKTNHVFVEKKAYPISAESLDLREEEISLAHYDSLHQQLPQCQILWNVPFQGGKIPSNTEKLELSGLTQEEADQILRYFPDLKEITVTGVEDYVLLESLQASLPEVSVAYEVTLGSTSYPKDTEALALKAEDYDFELLSRNLVHLPMVKTLQLKAPEVSMDQIQELQDAFPEIQITCTVEILGQEYTTDTTELDLSELTSDQVEATAGKLTALTGLQNVELNDKEGKSQLSMEDVKKLMDAAPEVKFHYTFDFYGVPITTTDEEVKINNKKIGDEGEANVRLALDLMQNCKRFVIEHCRISNEVLAKIRDDYREKTKVVWRIYFGEGTSLTDAEVLRSTYNVTDDNCHDLRYLEDVRYMDIGHNEFLDNIPFVEGMKSLEVVIISGAPVHDLTPFTHCPNLRILEMANCLYVPDLEPLKQCEKLEMLNISFTKISDLSPLDDLKLTYLCGVQNKVSAEEQERFMEAHPDCKSKFRGDVPYGKGWRYDENGDKLPWYLDISEVFRYPNSPNNVGWYLKKADKTDK